MALSTLRRKPKGTKVEWTHRPRPDGTFMPGYTFNGWWGCEKVSPGCKHCYAESFAKRTGHQVWGAHAPRRFFGDAHWAEPLKWDALAAKMGEQHLVFCSSMADWAETPADVELLAALNRERAKLFPLIERTRNLIWLLLTKRPENGMELVPAHWRNGFPDNVWALTTTENQEEADRRIPELFAFPARVRGVSAEPLLGPIDLKRAGALPRGGAFSDPVTGEPINARWRGLDWVIGGGESGHGARESDIRWHRSIRDQCARAGVAFFEKQLGATIRVPDGEPIGDLESGWTPYARTCISDDFLIRLTDRKGGDMTEWPFDLRVRQFPEVRA